MKNLDKANFSLDVSHLTCPVPLARIKGALSHLSSGQSI